MGEEGNLVDIPSTLEEKFAKAASIFESSEKFRIITHYDADGISAAAVLARYLMKSQKGFHATFTDSFPENLPKNYPIVFTDIGNSYLKNISKIEEPVVVLDHHDVKKGKEDIPAKDDKVFINPHEHGIDGAQDISGSSLALLFTVFDEETSWEESIYGLAGATADKQGIGGFTGYNEKLVRESIKKGFLEEEQRLFIDGENVKDALMKACDPYFPGLSGDENKIDEVLEDLEIDPESKVMSLSKDKERKLNSILALFLLRKGISVKTIESIYGTHYRLKQSRLDVDKLSKLLNSCARDNKPGLGLSICLGDKRSVAEAKKIRDEYRKTIVEKLTKLESEVKELDHIQYFFEEKKTMKGELAGLGMLYFLDQKKPVFGMVEIEDHVDISARGTKDMIQKGLDLGEICAKIGEKLGGRGGGHDIAAGVRIDKDRSEKFLDLVDEEVKRSLNLR